MENERIVFTKRLFPLFQRNESSAKGELITQLRYVKSVVPPGGSRIYWLKWRVYLYFSFPFADNFFLTLAIVETRPIINLKRRGSRFCNEASTEPLFLQQDWELTKGSVPWASAVRRWAEMQDGQRILLTTPSVLVGFRVEVYRAEGTTQWYTAVIVGYNESTKVKFSTLVNYSFMRNKLLR